MNTRESPPLFHLCFHRELPAGRRYSVYPGNAPAGHSSPQILDFFPDEYRVDFLHPHTPFTAHLQENEGSLKKILSTTMKAECPEKISFPFSFSGPAPERERPEKHIRVFTDGSLSPAGNGGWAGLYISRDGTITEQAGHEPCSSSNRMELMAVVKLLEKIPDSPDTVVVYTDSYYVIRGVRMWLRNWINNGFITALSRPVKNQDLWKKIHALIQKREILFSWVPSSSQDPFHTWCDTRAREASLEA